MRTVAEYFAEELRGAGVERVYGLPGGENVEVLDAIRRCGIDFILVKNESSACFMAATDARLTGGIGVALTTLGPGAANATAGLAHAYLDRAPVLLITAANDPEVSGKHSHQVIDLSAVFRPICKLTAELSAENAASTIQEAIRLARTGRPGPVHISIHNRIAEQAIPAGKWDGGRGVRHPHPKPLPHEEGGALYGSKQVDSLILGEAGGWGQYLQQPPKARPYRSAGATSAATRPIIVVGLGLEPSRPYGQLRSLAESLGAPVIDTPKSKGRALGGSPALRRQPRLDAR